MAELWSSLKQFVLLNINSVQNKNTRENNCLEDVPDEVAKRLIFSELSLLDGIRLRSVSKSCKERIKGICPRTQFPWLMLPRDDVDLCSKLSFFDMTRGVVHNYNLPSSLQGANFCGSSKGWLVFSKARNPLRFYKIRRRNIELALILFNPISNALHQLPLLTLLVTHDNTLLAQRHSQVLLVELSTADITCEDCVIAILYASDNVKEPGLGFCRPLDKQWTTFDHASYVDILFWKETTVCVLQATGKDLEEYIHKSTFKFAGGFEFNIIMIPYDMDEPSYIDVYFAADDDYVEDINDNEVVDDVMLGIDTNIEENNRDEETDSSGGDSDTDDENDYILDNRVGVLSHSIKDTYLVKSNNGDLLMILKVSDVFLTEYEMDIGVTRYVYRKTRNFQVFKMNPDDGKFKLIHDIGDQVIFLTLFGSISCTSNNFEGFRGNCIYFVEDTKKVSYDKSVTLASCDSGVYYLADNKIERCFPSLDFNTEDLMCWFMPTL